MGDSQKGSLLTNEMSVALIIRRHVTITITIIIIIIITIIIIIIITISISISIGIIVFAIIVLVISISIHQENMILENTFPIHGPLPMIIFFKLILARGQAVF